MMDVQQRGNMLCSPDPSLGRALVPEGRPYRTQRTRAPRLPSKESFVLVAAGDSYADLGTDTGKAPSPLQHGGKRGPRV